MSVRDGARSSESCLLPLAPRRAGGTGKKWRNKSRISGAEKSVYNESPPFGVSLWMPPQIDIICSPMPAAV